MDLKTFIFHLLFVLFPVESSNSRNQCALECPFFSQNTSGKFVFPSIERIQSHLHPTKFISTYFTEGNNPKHLKIHRTQEIEISEGFPKDSTSLLGQTHFHYSIARFKLHCSFTPLPANSGISSYKISLHNVTENSMCDRNSFEWQKESTLPSSVLSFNIAIFEEVKNYCIVITSLHQNDGNCSHGCIAELEDTVYIQTPAAASFYKRCENWNVTLLVQPFRSRIEVSFMDPTCFDSFEMGVYQVQNDCMNDVQEDTEPIGLQKFEKDTSGKNVLKFENIMPGSYCAKVRPVDELCQEVVEESGKYICTLLNSNVVHVESYQPIILPVEKLSDDASHQQVALISGITVLVVVVLIGIGVAMCWRLKAWNCVANRPVAVICGNGEVSKKMLPLGNISVFILHTYDEVIKSRVQTLANILRQSTGFEVEIADEQRYLLMINGEAWMRERLSYQCLNMGDVNSQYERRKIIVVESERAVSHQKYQSSFLVPDSSSNEIRSFEEDDLGIADCDLPLEELFVFGLTFLTSDLKRSLEDYCHLFVVRFEDVTRAETGLQGLVPNKRYSLPLHLPDLCADLGAPQ